MTILITGGAGYIGSHTVKYFQEQNEEIIVVDNLQSGHETSIDVDHLYNICICQPKIRSKDHSILGHFFVNKCASENCTKAQ